MVAEIGKSTEIVHKNTRRHENIGKVVMQRPERERNRRVERERERERERVFLRSELMVTELLLRNCYIKHYFQVYKMEITVSESWIHTAAM